MGKLPPLRVFCVAMIVSFGGSFHFGFQMLVTNPSQATFISFLNRSHFQHYHWELSHSSAQAIWSVIVACFFIGAIVGSLCIDFIGTRAGPKRGLYVSTGLSILGVLLAIISFHVLSFELYTVSRLIIGFAISLSLGLAAIFLNECSPKECRGLVSMITGIMVQVGTVVGAVIAMPVLLGSDSNWWYIYLIEIIILAVILVILPFIPESPVFLFLRKKRAEAKKAILFFQSCDGDRADELVGDIEDSLKANAASLSPLAICKDKYLRQGVVIGCVVSVTACFNGMAVINNYAVQILLNTGLSLQNASYGNIGFCGIMVVSSIIASVVIDRFGRRPLMLTSAGVIIFLNLLIFAFMFCFEKFQQSWLGFCLVAVIAVFLFFNAIGSGNLCFFLASELVGQSARGFSQTCATLIQMICRALVLAIFLPISEGIGTPLAYLILFVPIMIAAFLLLYFGMPETRNKDENQVVEAMINLPSIRSWFRRRNK